MTKTEVEECKKINIDWLLRQDKRLLYYPSGLITWTYGQNKSSVSYSLSLRENDSFLRLNYTQTNKWTEQKIDFDYKIYLTKIQCRYGGYRFYFLCPECRKRVSTVYLSSGIFCCRTCNKLIYRSQKENSRNVLFSAIMSMSKADDYLEKVKKWTYKGNLTRKAKVYIRKKERSNHLAMFKLKKMI